LFLQRCGTPTSNLKSLQVAARQLLQEYYH